MNIGPIFKGVVPSLSLPLSGQEVGLVQDSHIVLQLGPVADLPWLEALSHGKGTFLHFL